MRTFTIAVGPLDERLLRALADWGAAGANRRAMWILSRLGDGPVWYAAGLAAAGFGGATGRRLAFVGAAAGLFNALLYRACKRRFVRPRPFRTLPDLPLPGSPPHDFSFPSGHTLHAFAAATLVAIHFPIAGPPVFTLAALIGLSRVVLAVHYPSDVLAGAWLGLGIALAMHAAF